MKHILYCSKCQKYTMQEKCDKCGSKTLSRKPPKYSPTDKYAHYRREIKKNELDYKRVQKN